MLPSVDRVLRMPAVQGLIVEFGRAPVLQAIRSTLSEARASDSGDLVRCSDPKWIELRCRKRLESEARLSLRPVFNLTGTILHTNLGRALLPVDARRAVDAVASSACNLEFDLECGVRGDRDDHVERLLCALTGAEAATVVNNNAAAIFLLLNSLALRKEVIVSRGELIEIGGSFRLPEIMSRAGCRLREVGTTNRTHASDFEEAIGSRTGLLMKVHTSNYAIQGFTSAVDEETLAGIAQTHGLSLVVDLGSGTLVDLTRWGLPAEPTPRRALAAGANLVTFSGDKLLGGPQAGLLVGDGKLIQRIKRNPVRRALRVDKLRLAALEATLKLYSNPDALPEHLPVLRLMARSLSSIERVAQQVLPPLRDLLAGVATTVAMPTTCQIGSGSLPTQTLSSMGIAISPLRGPSGRGEKRLRHLAQAFRRLPKPVIGRLEKGALCFDLRCLEDADAFLAQLPRLVLP